MKKIQIAAILATTIAGFYAQSAQAQGTYTPGDVLIGFRSTSGSVTTDYLIDVGQSLFSQAASHGGTVTLGNFGTDLSAFDPNWFTDGTTKWGVAGGSLTGDASHVLYAGLAETSASATLAANVPVSYHGRTTAAQNTTIGTFNTVGGGYNTGGSIVAGPTTGDDGSFGYPLVGVQLQNIGAAKSASWWGQDTFAAGNAFQVFVGFDGTVGAGSNGNNLDLFQITPSVTTPVYEGTFNVSSTGTVTFSGVPEPSALTALAGGAGLLGLIRRRRSVAA